MATDPSCVVALRAAYLPGSSDQAIFFNICDYPSTDDEDIENLKCILDHGQVDINYIHDSYGGPPEPGAGGITGLMKAVMSGNAEMVQILCERGADLTLTDFEGKTALMLAQEELDALDEDDNPERINRIIDILTTYTQAAAPGLGAAALQAASAAEAAAAAAVAPLGGGGAAAAAAAATPHNVRPANNEKMDQMPNAWRD